MSITVNALGDACPIPVVKTIKAINSLSGAETIETHVDNETAVENLGKLAASKGFASSTEKIDDKHYVVKIEVGEATTVEESEADAICPVTPKKKKNIVAVISSNVKNNVYHPLGVPALPGIPFLAEPDASMPVPSFFYYKAVHNGSPHRRLPAMRGSGMPFFLLIYAIPSSGNFPTSPSRSPSRPAWPAGPSWS